MCVYFCVRVSLGAWHTRMRQLELCLPPPLGDCGIPGILSVGLVKTSCRSDWGISSSPPRANALPLGDLVLLPRGDSRLEALLLLEDSATVSLCGNSKADPALRGEEGVPYRASPMGTRRSLSDSRGDAPPLSTSRDLSCLYSTLLISEIWSGPSDLTSPESMWAPARRWRTSREGDAQG